MEPPGGISNISKSRCQQILSNTIYRVKIGVLEKKRKIRQMTGPTERGILAYFYSKPM